MKKRFGTMSATLCFAMFLAACTSGGAAGGGAAESAAGGASADAAEEVTIRVFNSKVEIAEPFNALISEYESQHPGVKIEVVSQMSDSASTALRSRFAAGQMPDLFSVTPRDIELWADQLADMSGEPWVGDVVDSAVEGATVDGKLLGFPLAIEGFGYLYNKDHFEKAGITALPTTHAEMREVVEKLEAAGFAPFVVPYGDWYNPGMFSSDNPFAKQPNPQQFIASLSDGAANIADDALFQDWVKSVRLEIDHAAGDPLMVDYNTQVTMFATGAGSMTTSCNCLQPMIDEIAPNLNIGIMSIPINDDADMNGNILVNTAYWGVFNDSEVKEEVKEFLSWMASDAGARYIAEEFKLVPAFRSMKVDRELIGPLGADVKAYVDANKTVNTTTHLWPDGTPTEFGSVLQKLGAQEIADDRVLSEFQAAWEKQRKQSGSNQ